MKNNMKYLVSLFVILSIISFFLLKNNHSTSAKETEFFIPKLQNEINDIDRILISKNDKFIKLTKANKQWQLAQADNFVADTNKVSNLLLALRKLKLKTKKTSNPQKYAKLQLADKGNNAAIVVKLFSQNNSVADVSLGKKSKISSDSYVRQNDKTQTWKVDGFVDISLDKSDWIINKIIDIDTSKIKSVTYQPISSASFTITKTKPQDKKYSLLTIQEKQQLKKTANLDLLANGLKNLTVESAILKKNLSDFKVDNSVIYELFTGLKIQLDTFEKDKGYMLNISLLNDETATELEKSLNNWVYQIPKYKYDALHRKLADLVEEKPKEANNQTPKKTEK